MVQFNATLPARQVRVMLVDDHEVVRQGVRSLIESIPDWSVCAEAGDGDAALRIAEQIRPDIVLLDVSLPKISGLDVIVTLKKLLPATEILILTMHDSERIVAQSLRAGARGYLIKSETGDRLKEALLA